VTSTSGSTSIDQVLAWHPHWDVWLVVGFLAFAYWYSIARIAPHVLPEGTRPVSRRQVTLFVAGLLTLWLVSDWPIHDIGEKSLFTFHMVEHLVISLVAAPLLLLGIPPWMARLVAGRPKVLAVLRPLSRPLAAFFFFNLVLAGLHWPTIIRLMVTNEFMHLGVHVALFASAILMWMPVLSPLPEVPRLGRPGAMMYLFAQSLVPTVPASFLVFGKTPLYDVYVVAPKLWDWDPMMDQAVAGLIMKLGGGFLLWITIAVIFFRWYGEERRWDAIETDLRAESSPSL